jgi:hypothetical protein
VSTSAQVRRPRRRTTIGRLVKAAGAAVGAAVVVGMGAFSLTISDSAVMVTTGPEAGGSRSSPPASTGRTNPGPHPDPLLLTAPTAATPGSSGLPQQTITQTAAPREPETPFARPTMTAPRFGGWCSFCSSNAALP